MLRFVAGRGVQMLVSLWVALTLVFVAVTRPYCRTVGQVRPAVLAVDSAKSSASTPASGSPGPGR